MSWRYFVEDETKSGMRGSVPMLQDCGFKRGCYHHSQHNTSRDGCGRTVSYPS